MKEGDTPETGGVPLKKIGNLGGVPLDKWEEYRYNERVSWEYHQDAGVLELVDWLA